MRIRWAGKDAGELRARLHAYADIGVQHVLVEPENREVDDWDAIIAGVGRIAAG